jgi:hypothetical protein
MAFVFALFGKWNKVEKEMLKEAKECLKQIDSKKLF